MGRKCADDERRRHHKPSFFVRIFFRRNTTIQGEIQWMEGRQTQHFRSALELLSLIQEAVDRSEDSDLHQTFRSWEESSPERCTGAQQDSGS